MAAAKSNTGLTIDCSHLFDGLFDDDAEAVKGVHETTKSYIDGMFEEVKRVEEPEVREAYFDRIERQAQAERDLVAQVNLQDKVFKGGVMIGAAILVGYCFQAWVNRPQGA